MKKIFVGKSGYIRAGWSVSLSVIVYVLSSVIAAIIAMFVFGSQVLNNIPLNNCILTFQQILYAVGLILLFRLLYKKPLAQLGLDKKRLFPRFLIGFGIGGVAATAVSLFGTTQITWIGITPRNALPILTSLLLMLTVGFGEELFARGFIMTAMRTTGSKIAVFLSSAVIFSLIHLANPEYRIVSFINVAILGLIFGYALVRTGSLWLSVGIHSAWNFFISSVWGTGTGQNLPDSLFSLKTPDSQPFFIGSFEIGISDLLALSVYILIFLVIRFVIPKDPSPAWTLDKI